MWCLDIFLDWYYGAIFLVLVFRIWIVHLAIIYVLWFLSLCSQLIGWTPLVEMKNIAKKEGVQARLVGKMEAYQPLCSVKDRSALRCVHAKHLHRFLIDIVHFFLQLFTFFYSDQTI